MKSWIKIAVASVLLLGANGVFAQDNTDAGTTIGNTATVTYDVEGITQEAESDTAEFVVDRVILVTVASVSGENVAPGAQDQALEFTVTNDSNATLDFALSHEAPTGDFVVTGVTYYLDANNGDVTVDPGEGEFGVGDTVITSIDDLAEEETVTIFVVADVPVRDDPTPLLENGDTTDIILIATAYETDGTTLVVETNTTSTNENPTTDPLDVDGMFMDTVFGDAAGDATLTTLVASAGPDADTAGDDAEDGHHSATATYTVATADITVAKSSVVVEDPFNGTTNPKAIPGATVRYCISITNGSATAADDVTVTDNVPVNTDYVEGSMRMDTDCDLTTGTPVTLDDDNAGADDLVTVDRGSATTAGDPGGTDPGDEGVVTTVDVLLPASTTTTTIFDVTIR